MLKKKLVMVYFIVKLITRYCKSIVSMDNVFLKSLHCMYIKQKKNTLK